MSTTEATIEQIQRSPHFRAISEKALADDAKVNDAKRREAGKTLDETLAYELSQLAEIKPQLAAAHKELDAAEAARDEAIENVRRVMGLGISLSAEVDSRRYLPLRTMEETLPDVLPAFYREVCREIDETCRNGPRTWKRTSSFLGLISGKRKTETVGNGDSVRARLVALRAARDEVRQLTQVYLPLPKLQERIRAMRESIPLAD